MTITTDTIHWVFQWKKPDMMGDYELVNISYNYLKLCRSQHTFAFVILGLGFYLFWWTGEPCSKEELKAIWGEDKPRKKKKKFSTVRSRKKKK
jgi:hypothetical protein